MSITWLVIDDLAKVFLFLSLSFSDVGRRLMLDFVRFSAVFFDAITE